MSLKEDIRFKQTSYIDSLTGIYNRYFLNKALPEVIEKTAQAKSNLGVMMIDLDNFKNINDTHGHLKGDVVLKEVAAVINSCIRAEDEVIRWAGDEFIVLFLTRGQEIAPLESFVIAARRIVERFAQKPLKIEGQEFALTISAGLAVFPRDGQTKEELIDAADKALYLSKEKGKNRLSFAEEVAQADITMKEVSRLFPPKKFINRLTQIEVLKKTLQEVEANKTSFVLLTGKSGIGKTRIMDEFKKIAESRQIFSLKITTSANYALMPYQSLSLALTDFLKKNNTLFLAMIASLSQEEIIALSGVMPIFKSFIKDPAKGKPAQQGVNLFKALRNICVELSSFHGLLLYFDNIRWLDKATFELLNYILTYEFVRKIMICGVIEESQLEDNSACRDFLASPREKINFLRIEVPPLSLQETKELITGVFSEIILADEFFQYIYEITEGAPLFIEEMLKYLVESGIILYKEKHWQLEKFNKEDIPSSLEEVLQRRFRRLDPETKEMLAKAVVIGEDFESEVLRQTIKKDQGYLFELLDRAKKKSFISSKGEGGKFNFMANKLQKVIYEQMQPQDKVKMHQEVMRSLEESSKELNPGILGDLAYHSQKAGDDSKFREYGKKMLEDSLELFDLKELGTYLEALAQDKTEAVAEIPAQIRIQKIDSQLSEEALIKALDLIKHIFTAFSNISLYPTGNKMRDGALEKVYESLLDIFKDTPSITFSEVEKILLVNNKRLKHQQERLGAVEDFLFFITNRDIKSIQFLSGISKDELNLVLELLAQDPETLRGGLIAQLLYDRGAKYVRLYVASYQRLAAQERFKPLTERMNKIILMDFLSGKAKPQDQELENLIQTLRNEPQNLARNLMEIAKSFSPQDRASSPREEAKIITESIKKISEELLTRKDHESQKNLSKMIFSLDDTVKPYVFAQQDMPMYKDMVKSLSDKEVVDIIMTARKMPDKESVLSMRQLYNKLVGSSEKAENITSILEEKLKKEGLSESEISFVTEKEYDGLSLQERIETVIKLPVEAYSSLGQGNIQDLLGELIDDSAVGDLGQLIRRFLSELESGSSEIKEQLLNILGLFFSLAPVDSSEFDLLIMEAAENLNKMLVSAGPELIAPLLKDLKSVIEWAYKGVFMRLNKERWVLRSRFEQIDKIMDSLYALADSQDDQTLAKEKKEAARNFISLLQDSQFIEALAEELKDPFLEYNKLIEKQIARLGRDCLRKILGHVLRVRDLSWEGYLYRQKIAVILKNIGKPAKEEVIYLLSSEKAIDSLKQVIEIAGFMQEEELVPIIKSFTEAKDYEIKETAILVLAKSSSPLARQAILALAKDKDPRIARLVKRELRHPYNEKEVRMSDYND